MNEVDTGLLGAAMIALAVIVGTIVLLYLIPLRLWIAAWSSGAYVGLVTLVGMRLRRVPPSTVVTARISAVKAGLAISINDLEARLPSPPFFRAHRSTIANMDQVAAIDPMFKGSLVLTMKDSQASEIQVSERQAKHVRELLQL